MKIMMRGIQQQQNYGNVNNKLTFKKSPIETI